MWRERDKCLEPVAHWSRWQLKDAFRNSLRVKSGNQRWKSTHLPFSGELVRCKWHQLLKEANLRPIFIYKIMIIQPRTDHNYSIHPWGTTRQGSPRILQHEGNSPNSTIFLSDTIKPSNTLTTHTISVPSSWENQHSLPDFVGDISTVVNI